MPSTAKKKSKKKARMLVRPLDDRVIVRIDDAEEVTPGGIVLPAACQEQSQFATVVAVGPGAPWKEWVVNPDPLMSGDASHQIQPRYPMTVKQGDRVIIGRFAGAPMEFEDQKYTIVREADILCVVDEAQEK